MENFNHAKFVESQFHEFIEQPLTVQKMKDICMRYNITTTLENQI